MHILFHRPTPWSSSVQCSTKTLANIAAEEGHSVTYLQSSINLAHWITGRGYYSTWKEGPRIVNDRIQVTSGLSVIPDMTSTGLYSNWLAAASYRTSIPSIRKQVQRSGFGEPDLIWTTIPGSSVLGKIFPKAQMVFHVIDLYKAFRGTSISKLEAHDYRACNHVFCIGHSLKKYLVDELDIDESKITVLGQGVHLNNYRSTVQEPDDLKGIPRPRALWVGVLDKLDEGLLAQTAKEIQSLGGSIVLVGPKGSRSEEFLKSGDLSNAKNLHVLGPRNSEEVPAYMQHCDLGLMLYDRNRSEVYRGQNPLKLYEYLAADLPVISTPHDEFRFIKPPVEVVEDEHEIEHAVSACLQSENHGSTARKEFVDARSWSKIFRVALEIVESNRS